MRSRAFSLVEVMIVIAVLMVIAAIIAPVILRAKDAAKGANDISNLRQLGLAATMYMEQHGEPPLGCPVVVEERLAPPALCSGMLDPYPEGLANRLVKSLAQSSSYYVGLDVTYRSSFAGLREFGVFEELVRDIWQNDVAPGWLVDLAPSDTLWKLDPQGASFSGRYRRLMLDGSVQWRSHQTFSTGARGGRVWMPIMLFADVDEKWVNTRSGPPP